MGEGRPRFTANRLTRVVVMFIGLSAAIVCLFLPWWSVTNEPDGVREEQHARPFEDDAPERDGLDDAVIITGAFTVPAILAALLFLGIEVQPAVGRMVGPTPRLVVVATCVAFGAIAGLYTLLGWPPADGRDVAFYDRQEFALGANETLTVTYAPGLGWYLWLLSAVLLPIVSFTLYVREFNTPAPSSTRTKPADAAAARRSRRRGQ